MTVKNRLCAEKEDTPFSFGVEKGSVNLEGIKQERKEDSGQSEEMEYQNPIIGTRIYQSLKEELEEGKQIFYRGVVDSLKPFLAVPFAKKWVLYLCKNEERAREVLQNFKSFTDSAYYYPPKDFLFYKADTRGHFIVRERGECLRHLLEDPFGALFLLCQWG